MRVQTNNVYPNGIISSYRIAFGRREAQQLGLIDKDGEGLQIIPVRTQSGVLLIPVDKPHDVLVYKGFRTHVYSSNGLYCGEIDGKRNHASWYTKDPDKIEYAFYSAVDRMLAEGA